jgi:hypothetical protein
MSGQLGRVHPVPKTGYDTVDGTTTVYATLKPMRHIESNCPVAHRRHSDGECGRLPPA